METPKKKATANASSPNQCHLLAGSDDINDTMPIQLNESKIAQIVAGLSESANQERRFIQTLARKPNIVTKEACRTIACVNLSHLRRETALRLAGYGLEARCVHPPKPIKNGFGENTGQVMWGLYDLGGDV